MINIAKCLGFESRFMFANEMRPLLGAAMACEVFAKGSEQAKKNLHMSAAHVTRLVVEAHKLHALLPHTQQRVRALIAVGYLVCFLFRSLESSSLFHAPRPSRTRLSLLISTVCTTTTKAS